MFDDDIALTEDERNAGVGDLIRARGRGRRIKTKRSKAPPERPKFGPGSKWSEEDKILVRYLFEENHSVKTIANKLNRSPYAIAWKLFENGKISKYERERFSSNHSHDITKEKLNEKKIALSTAMKNYHSRPDVIQKKEERKREKQEQEIRKKRDETSGIIGTGIMFILLIIYFLSK